MVSRRVRLVAGLEGSKVWLLLACCRVQEDLVAARPARRREGHLRLLVGRHSAAGVLRLLQLLGAWVLALSNRPMLYRQSTAGKIPRNLNYACTRDVSGIGIWVVLS